MEFRRIGEVFGWTAAKVPVRGEPSPTSPDCIIRLLPAVHRVASHLQVVDALFTQPMNPESSAMPNDEIIYLGMKDVEISFFDQDPDGDEDRAGDGWYFQIPGDEGWDGPYHSEDETQAVIFQSLEDRDLRLARKELTQAGFRSVRFYPGGLERYARRGEGDTFVVIDLCHPAQIDDDYQTVRVSSCSVPSTDFTMMHTSAPGDSEHAEEWRRLRMTEGLVTVGRPLDGEILTAVIPAETALFASISVEEDAVRYGHLQAAARSGVEAAEALAADMASSRSHPA